MASQAVIFQRLRYSLFRNALGLLLEQSTIRVISIVLTSLVVWGSIFGVSWMGFQFLANKQIPFSGAIVSMLFDMLFLSLSVLLIFSGGIILFSSLFSSTETAFLLSLPARADQVFAYKFQTAIAFSSWAFLLLGSPILIAYAVAYTVPWYFYAMLPLFFVGFVLLPGSLGALACILLVNVAPRRLKQAMAIPILALIARLGWLGFHALRVARETTTEPLQQLLGQLAFAQSDWMPSHWMTRGLLTAARGEWGESLFQLALVWSNGLFLYVVTAYLANRLYRRGYNLLATGGTMQRRAGGQWVDGAVTTLLFFLDQQTRLLILKDFRTFRRDPAQWAQVSIFGGLLILFFLQTRSFYQNDLGRPYQNGVSLLTLAVTALLMCAYTGRFIYPMLSLEGRKFWLLGLLPLSRDRLLWGKFAFSAVGTVLVSEFVVGMSDLLLGLSPLAVVLHALAALVLALGLSGLSVGLGAWMPNFQESDPSKIAVGFGGTLNLVTGLLFIVTVVALIAGPYHILVAATREDAGFGVREYALIGIGVSLGIVVGMAAVVFPLRIGTRHLRQIEF
jgi:ABC-2 type transport system permease protein